MGRKKIDPQIKHNRMIEYKKNYNKNITKRYVVSVNKKTESSIIEHLDKQKQYGRYIKDLIKKDMEEQE